VSWHFSRLAAACVTAPVDKNMNPRINLLVSFINNPFE